MTDLTRLSADAIRWRTMATDSALDERDEADDAARAPLVVDLALYRLAAGADPVSLRPQFRTASRHIARWLAAGAAGAADPWTTLDLLSVVGSFGNAEDRRAVRGLDAQTLGDAEDPRQAGLLRLMGALARSIGGVRLEAIELGHVVTACEADTASRPERQELMPLARGLLAAEGKDGRGWNLALAQLTAAHAGEARWGDRRWHATGLVSLTGLMLMKRGLDLGLTCRARSPYLPVGLVANTVPA